MLVWLPLLPDWSSLDKVRSAHNFLEVAALVFFALLVISEAFAHLLRDEKRKHIADTVGIVFFAIAVLAEIVAYRYGKRNDDLSGAQIVSLDEKATDASARAAKAAADSAVAGLNASRADEKADEADTAAKTAGKAASIAQAASSKAGAAANEAETHASAIDSTLQSEIAKEAKAEEQLEAEKQKRLRLAGSLRDRSVEDQSGLMNQLSKLPPHRVIFFISEGAESRGFAGQLAFVFGQLGWSCYRRPSTEDLLPGVSVDSGSQIKPVGSAISTQDEMNGYSLLIQTRKVADQIRSAFQDHSIDLARIQHVPHSFYMPASTILIGVGPKANREAEKALDELGRPESTLLTSRGIRMGGNSVLIPLDPEYSLPKDSRH